MGLRVRPYGPASTIVVVGRLVGTLEPARVMVAIAQTHSASATANTAPPIQPTGAAAGMNRKGTSHCNASPASTASAHAIGGWMMTLALSDVSLMAFALERFHIDRTQETAPAFLHCRIFGRKTGSHFSLKMLYPGFFPNDFTAASAARSPDSQAPPTVPQSVSCAASPANQMRSLTDSISTRRAGCPPGAAAEKAPSTQGSSFQWVAARRLIVLARSLP